MNALVACLPLALLGAELYEQRDFGFQIDVPEGWARREVASSERSVHLVLEPEAARGSAQLSIQATSASPGTDPRLMRDEALRAGQKLSAWSGLAAFDGRAAGREAAGLRGEVLSGGQNYSVEQLYLHANGITYLLQSAARTDEWARWQPEFARILGAFALSAPADRLAAQHRLRELAARCGSELPWAASWAEAAERARASGRLVLVSARVYPGFELSDELSSGPYMDPDIVALVQERYVPLRYPCSTDVPFAAPEVYGLSATTFGIAALLVSPEGRVLRETWVPTYEFLAEGVQGWPGPPAAQESDALAQARLHLRRGEHAQARALLTEARTAPALALLADLHRRERDGAAALAAITAARAASGAEPLEAELALCEAEVWLGMGELARAAGALEELAAGASAQVPQALFRLGAARRVLLDRQAAEATWQRLLEDHAENRWAWKAAATLTGTAWALDRSARSDWGLPEEHALLRPSTSAPRPSSQASLARTEALAWLRAQQRPAGDWPVARSLARGAGEPPDDFQLAITALSGLALLPRAEAPDAAGASARAVAWLRDGYARARAQGGEVHFMDYGVWSRACMLLFLSACRERALLDAQDFGALAAALLADLRAKQRAGGGWSYYVKSDLAASAEDQQSISFVTAAVVLAVMRARAAGAELPPGLLEAALDQLERMRNANATFEYMLAPDAPGTPRATSAPGAAGRSPLCMLALQRGGRATLADLHAALELFVAHRAGLASEVGKALLHTGQDGQGSHYVLFDYAFAAAAIAALPGNERAPYAEALLAEILRTRTSEGAFLDSPSLGAACGTALGLLALEDLGVR